MEKEMNKVPWHLGFMHTLFNKIYVRQRTKWSKISYYHRVDYLENFILSLLCCSTEFILH